MSKFKCYHCTKCCRIDKYSTLEEFEIARETLSKLDIELKGAKLSQGFILWPKPCPALKGNKCLIYNVRPYPCRSFLCGKQSKEDNRPWKDENFNMTYYNWQLDNNKEFAKIKEEMEDEAAKWGNEHGWKLEKITR